MERSCGKENEEEKEENEGTDEEGGDKRKESRIGGVLLYS